jgi:PAS domain S-box-containing protein
MEKNSERESEPRSPGETNDSGTPRPDTVLKTGEALSFDVSDCRILLEFFSKEQFLAELRTLNVKLSELRHWHDEWEQKQKALEDERDKYRLLEAAISEVILVLDASLRVVHCTSSIESLTGHRKEEVVSKRLEKLITPPSFKTFMEELADELVATPMDGRAPKYKTTELELYAKAGGSVAGSAKISIRRGTDREPAEIILIFRSIDDKKQSEKILWETKEQYRILFRDVKEAAYFINAQGVFLDVNPAWLERHGYTRDEIIGVDIREVFTFPSKHPLYHHRAEGRETRRFHAKLKKKSGEEQESVITATAWRGQGGELLGYLGVIYEPEEEPGDAKPKSSGEDFRDTLLAAVVHELKKPVSVVTQGLDQVSHAVRDPMARETFEKVKQAAARASRVTNSVLDLYRGSPPTYEQTDAAAVNREVLLSFDEEMRARNISVITDFAADLPRVKIDAGRLAQIITNIISNAMTAMPRSGVITLKATKHAGEDGKDFVRLIYADTGRGMSQYELRKVFDPFFTTKGDAGGIGLGLTLSKEIIERCGGSIGIESRPGEGTTVTLLLPSN